MARSHSHQKDHDWKTLRNPQLQPGEDLIDRATRSLKPTCPVQKEFTRSISEIPMMLTDTPTLDATSNFWSSVRTKSATFRVRRFQSATILKQIIEVQTNVEFDSYPHKELQLNFDTDIFQIWWYDMTGDSICFRMAVCEKTWYQMLTT